MKNAIYYYYNIYPKKIINNNGKMFFFINEEKIYIEKIDDDIHINELVNISNEYYYRNYYVNTFLINKNGEYISNINNRNIVLLKVNSMENSNFNIDDIIKFQKIKIKNNLNSLNIIEMWKKEVDMLELELMEYNKEYKLIQQSFNYFIGLAENAIQLYTELNKINKFEYNSIGHIKLESVEDLNNPLLFVKIDDMYDIAKYIKTSFFEEKINYGLLDVFCARSNSGLLFNYLMYPDYYFDLIKEILLENQEEKELKKILSKIGEYKKLLIYCKQKIKNNYELNLINWIDKE